VFQMGITVQVDLVPSASFTANYTTIIAGQYVGFTDTTTSGNPPLAYQWNFGDGPTNSTLQNPAHQFTAAGAPTVTLTVTDFNGNASVFQMGITVQVDLIPLANFTVNATYIERNQYIQFTDTTTSGNPPLAYQWNFGDGPANSTQQNPLHQYTSYATCTVTLTVSDADGDISVHQTVIYILPDTVPVASFTANYTSIVVGQYVGFTDTTTLGNPPLHYEWNFGDGPGNSTLQNPAHQYLSVASFIVTLTVNDTDNNASVCTLTIMVVANLFPNASFIASATSIVAGEYVAFANLTADGNLPLAFQWNFGDGSPNDTTPATLHQFTTGGTFTVTLTVVDFNGDMAVSNLTITVAWPKFVASFTAKVVIIKAGESIAFTDNTTGGEPPYTYQWNFGDGTANATTQSPTHLFATAGTFTVTLTVTDANGNTGVYNLQVTVNGGEAPPGPNMILIYIILAVAAGAVVIGIVVARSQASKRKGKPPKGNKKSVKLPFGEVSPPATTPEKGGKGKPTKFSEKEPGALKATRQASIQRPPAPQAPTPPAPGELQKGKIFAVSTTKPATKPFVPAGKMAPAKNAAAPPTTRAPASRPPVPATTTPAIDIGALQSQMMDFVARGNEMLATSLGDSLPFFQQAAEIADHIKDPLAPVLHDKIKEIKEVLWQQGTQ